MNEIIARVIELVNKQLLLPSRDRSGDFILIYIRNGVNEISTKDSLNSNWIHLFCRQMNRLMDYNELISFELWMEWYDDIVCILYGRSGKLLKNDSWERFLYKMEFESKLEEEFQKISSKRKTLNELICEYKDFFQNYLQKCLLFHSKIQVQGLIGNINDFINQITDISLNLEEQKYLQEKFKSIEIDLNCSDTSLEYYSTDDLLETKDSTGFLPSVKQTGVKRSGKFKKIQDILESNRWIVILGDPGSSKTTLLRWITHTFAEKILNNNKEFIRIPILIRIGEFAEWIISNKEKSLRDYIGKHTWFSQRYCINVKDEIILKDLIDYGYALILLDGLDEISDIAQRENIVKLVREFIKEYVRASDFVSAFDKKMVRKHNYLFYPDTIETSLPSKSSGNQIIITSRFTGYELYPIIGPFIEHYSVSSINEQKAKEFVKKLLELLEKNVIDIFIKENIKLNEEKLKQLSDKRLACMELIFDNKSKFLLLNFSLLSLICTLIFQAPDQLNLKSPVEIYSHIVKSSLALWKLNIPESLLIDVLINLATYLHLNSPSGLIDEFDLKHLCSLTLKQSSLVINRRQIPQYINELMNFMEKNIAFVIERGLQVFSFQHLSFQEYFVAQSFLKNSSIEQMAKRILLFTLDFRFYESIIFSVSSISYNRSYTDYEKFCQYLITSTNNNSIPFGTILFFDAFNQMKIKPSNSIIFQALNNLFNHSSTLIGATYLLWNLSKLSDDIIQEWMEIYIKDDESISKFCQCLFRKYLKKSERNQPIQKLPSIVYQQLWSVHNKSRSIDFDIDQILRFAIPRDNITNEIFNKNLSSYFYLNNIRLSNIHPMILSVIISVSGGAYYQIKDQTLHILFSTKQMHRESLILTPILEYFLNPESHSNKIQKLKNYYENFLENSSLSDTSSIIVDTFIALICLQGVSQISFYEKYKNYKSLPLALERFKWNWFHFMISGLCIDLGTGEPCKISNIKSELKTILDNQSDEKQKHLFFLACANALMKLQRFDMSDLLDFHKVGIIHNIRLYDNSCILINYLPQSLRKLCFCIMNSSINKTDSLPSIVFLIECIKQLKNVRGDDPIFYHGLSILKSLLDEHSLENYALAIFRERYSNINCFSKNSQCDKFFIQSSFNWETLIHNERKRINQNLNRIESEEKDLKLFAASISLAQIYQSKTAEYYILPTSESQPIYFAIMNISNSILRIILINIILDLNNPFIFNEEQRDELRDEMIGLLYSSDLPLLTLTYLFIRSYRFQIFFPELFQEMSIIIGEKFNRTSENIEVCEKEAAFIALRQLHDFKLSNYLKEFAKQLNNLSDILEFNSTIFYKYFNDKTSFESCNTSLLSIMYLIELTFDVQILKIYIEDNEKQYDSFTKQINHIWNESARFQKLMTFKLAKLITNNLDHLNKNGISFIRQCISECVSIEDSAIPLMENWLKYKTNKNLKFLAEYAALELIINGSNNSDLNDIVNEMFRTKNYSRIISVSKRLFASPFVNLTIIRQILTSLQKNLHDASKISLSINRKDILELILDVEFNQFTSNVNQQDEIFIRPFILMIDNCSKNVQFNLLEYLRTFINEQLQIEDSVKEKYISIIIKWIIDRIIDDEKRNTLLIDLYEYIFALLHNQQFPFIQKTIINSIDNVFQNVTQFEMNIFMQDDIINNLEQVIYWWYLYPIDVVSVCLLSYGNCLLRLQILQVNLNLPDEIKKILNHICDIFYPEIISIRASFCLVYSENSNRNHNFISNLFSNKQNLTSDITFQILLEQTLYRTQNEYYGLEDIIEHLITHPESINIFVMNLYNYLCKKNSNKFLNDRVPNCIRIEESIREKHSNIFFNAIRNSSFGEEEFKTQLYNYSKNNPMDLDESINIYSYFGILTIELLDMLESWNGRLVNNIWERSCLNNLKQISDRNTVQNLFHLLNQYRYESLFKSLLLILQVLVRANVISLSEVHKELPLIKNISYESSFKWRNEEENLFDFLLEISCFKNERASLRFQTTFTTTDLIDTEFNDQINRFNQTLNINCGGSSAVGLRFPKRTI